MFSDRIPSFPTPTPSLVWPLSGSDGTTGFSSHFGVFRFRPGAKASGINVAFDSGRVPGSGLAGSVGFEPEIGSFLDVEPAGVGGSFSIAFWMRGGGFGIEEEQVILVTQSLEQRFPIFQDFWWF